MEEVFVRMQEAFLAAGKKEEFCIVGAALQAGLDLEAVETYMLPTLDAGQLLEMMAAIMDKMPKRVLEQFKTGKLSADDMREMRLGSRGDMLMKSLFQEVSNLTELVSQRDYQEQLKTIIKMCKDTKKELAQLKLTASNPEEGRMRETNEAAMEGSIEDLQKLEEAEGVFLGMPKVENAEGVFVEKPKVEKAKEISTDYYHAESGSFIEPVSKPKKSNRLLAFFRRLNVGKIETREEEKKLSVINFMQKNLDEETLTAALEAVRKGVPYDHISHVVDADSSPEKIRLLTTVYLYMFGGEAEAAYAPA